MKGDDTIYKLIAINGNSEIVIHYPLPNKDLPYLNKLSLKEGLSQVENLSFSIYPDNPGYDQLFELSTRIKVIDVRDNTIRFTGRVLDVSPQMDSSGKFFKDVVCEGALSYLNDTKTRAETYLGNPLGFINWILTKHNNKVEDTKKIYPGNIDVTGSVAYTCTFDTTLNTILTVKDKSNIGGNIRVREESGVLYLDWLKNFTADTVEVRLGKNMSEMVKEKDVTSLGTRVIPLGANNLTIESVNGGIDYIEDSNARNLYGVIEKTVQYSDITDAQELFNKAVKDLPSNTQPKYLLSTKALDLSFISGTDAKMFKLGTNLHLINPVLNVDDTYKIVSLDLDLLQPYNPTIEIANKPVTGTSSINDLRKDSISNNSVHNGVQVGDDFGIRIVSGDGKFVTTLNATEGISIEDVIRNLKMFFVDIENSTLTMDGIQQLTKDGKVVIINTTNDKGGLFEIFDNNGNLNVSAGSESGSADNTGGTINLYNDYVSKKRVDLGIVKNGDYGVVQVHNSTNKVKAGIYGDKPDLFGPGLYIFDDSGSVATYLTETGGSINLEPIATREWVEDYVASHMPNTPEV
jgi:hypothetical protein